MSIDRDAKRLRLCKLKDQLGDVWLGIEEELAYWNDLEGEYLSGTQAGKHLDAVEDMLNLAIGRLTSSFDLDDSGEPTKIPIQ